jgi:ribosomal protein S18 acetylase RimI-like enzyme
MIRVFQVGDDKQLEALVAAVDPDFEPPPSPSPFDTFAAFLEDPSSFVLGAYVDGAPVGLAWGIQMRSPRGKVTTYLHQLDVLEKCRRQGIGTALVREAMALARRHGSTRFWLSTGGHNDVAQALYESLGGERKPLGDVNYWWQLE